MIIFLDYIDIMNLILKTLMCVSPDAAIVVQLIHLFYTLLVTLSVVPYEEAEEELKKERCQYKNKQKKEKNNATVKEDTRINLNHMNTEISTTNNNSTHDNKDHNIESCNKNKNHMNTNKNTNTKMNMNMNMNELKDENDCTEKITALQTHHFCWWSHLDQHHHQYLLLLCCFEHLFVSLTLFQRTFIILIPFTYFISTLANVVFFFISLTKTGHNTASVGEKSKDIDMNSVSDTSNDENKCLNKKIKEMKVATMNSTQMKMTKKNRHSNEVSNKKNKKKKKKNSVAVIDNWCLFWCLFCCCLAQAIQFLTVDHPLLWWLAWLTYSVDSGWWPLITVISVSKY